jgi:hypothetical protein
MDIHSATPTSSCTRRRILGWGGAGALGGLAGYLGLQSREAGGITDAKPRAAESTAAISGQSADNRTELSAGGNRREDFLPHLKSTFELDTGVSCTLVEVSAGREIASPTAVFTSFSLLFNAPAGVEMESGIHHLTHPLMGALDLFLSPVGRSAERTHLEAVFSQRI